MKTTKKAKDVASIDAVIAQIQAIARGTPDSAYQSIEIVGKRGERAVTFSLTEAGRESRYLISGGCSCRPRRKSQRGQRRRKTLPKQRKTGKKAP